MDYTTFQSIILVKDSLNAIQRKQIVENIQDNIQSYTKRIKVLDQDARPLAYEIEGYENALFIAIEFSLKTIGSSKRIKKIQENLNTIEEILNYKIIQKDKEEIQKLDNTAMYIVYEFDYGDISKEIEPRVTHFGGFDTREKAIVQANELLEEGLESYFIESGLADNMNPFEDNDEVHLYEKEAENEQNVSAYYIKIQKINIE